MIESHNHNHSLDKFFSCDIHCPYVSNSRDVWQPKRQTSVAVCSVNFCVHEVTPFNGTHCMCVPFAFN